jgi:hypothetical protein
MWWIAFSMMAILASMSLVNADLVKFGILCLGVALFLTNMYLAIKMDNNERMKGGNGTCQDSE